MSKPDDFGGLPQVDFTAIVATFSTAPKIADADKIRILGALAEEEHAAAKSRGSVDTLDVVVTCLQIRTKHDLIKGNKDTAGPPKADIDGLETLLNNLRQLWV